MKKAKKEARNAILGLILVVGSISSLVALGEEDRDAAIQGVILSQIEAFANDDKNAAYSYASEAIQEQTGSVETFYNMVKLSYGPVHGASAIEFMERVPHPGFEIQKVRLTGPEGQRWDATYRMEQDGDDWRIAGVALKKAPGTI